MASPYCRKLVLCSLRVRGCAADAAKNKNASERFGGSYERSSESKTPRRLSGRRFLQERVYTNFYFFVKGNIQLFLFFLELVSFQEHSSPIPQPIFSCAATGLAKTRAS